MEIKVEKPDCSSVEEDESTSAKAFNMPMGPAKPHKQHQKTSVKGLHICHICGQDYMNKSDLSNHIGQYEGLTFTYELCHKVFYSFTSFDTHSKAHESGPHQCNQCGQTFEYATSLSNHVKTQSKVYICEEEACEKKSRSYAMYLEHMQYGHIESKTIPCPDCDLKFQTPTQMYSH